MNFEKILEFKMPRYEELPAIELYIDQVLKYIETVFEPLEICKDEKPLTASMVNNYVKKGVVPATSRCCRPLSPGRPRPSSTWRPGPPSRCAGRGHARRLP